MRRRNPSATEESGGSLKARVTGQSRKSAGRTAGMGWRRRRAARARAEPDARSARWRFAHDLFLGLGNRLGLWCGCRRRQRAATSARSAGGRTRTVTDARWRRHRKPLPQRSTWCPGAGDRGRRPRAMRSIPGRSAPAQTRGSPPSAAVSRRRRRRARSRLQRVGLDATGAAGTGLDAAGSDAIAAGAEAVGEAGGTADAPA